VDLERPETVMEVTAGAVIVATGYRPSDPTSRPHYGYGHRPNVLSGVELEERLRNGRGLTGKGGEIPRRVAFIQCVGSRDREHPYCSQVCCAYTLRLARLLKHRRPEAEITTFYMDFQNIGRETPRFQTEACREISVARALPGDLRAAPDGSLQLRYLDDTKGGAVEAAFDLVVLSVGITPGADNPALATLLRLELTPEGFFKAADPQQRSQTSQPGIFLAGTAEGPRDIAGCIVQALAAARRASQYVSKP
jgi:heterodisulfide reductase subunit A